MAKKSKSADGGATPATVALTTAGKTFLLHTYEPDPAAESKGLDAAVALGVSASKVFKTLLADVDGTLVVGVVPVDRQLDLKAIAKAAGGRKAAMADVARAQRSTGYVVGGISPIGQRQRLATYIDASIEALDTVICSAGRRGLQIELSPQDLIEMTSAKVETIARQP